MRALYKFVLITFLVLVIVLGALAAAAVGIYQIYLKPQPAQFEFSRDVSTITAIEIVSAKKVGEEQFEFTPVSEITDKESFLADFGAMKCNKGMSVQALVGFSALDNIQAIKITYSDSSFEIITPYGNIDSGIFTPDMTPDALLKQEFFMFDETEFSGLINKYSIK